MKLASKTNGGSLAKATPKSSECFVIELLLLATGQVTAAS